MINITMVKKHSQRSVRIFSDKKDPHFANVEILGSRTGKTERHFILASETGQWRGIYQREGFTITEQK